MSRMYRDVKKCCGHRSLTPKGSEWGLAKQRSLRACRCGKISRMSRTTLLQIWLRDSVKVARQLFWHFLARVVPRSRHPKSRSGICTDLIKSCHVTKFWVLQKRSSSQLEGWEAPASKETGYQRRGDREKERAAEYLRQQAAEAPCCSMSQTVLLRSCELLDVRVIFST